VTDPVEAGLERLLPHDAPQLLVRFARFWLECRRGHAMPAFSDLDPTAMPWALPFIFVIDRRADGTPYYRLVGEEMTAHLGGRVVNKTASDVFEPAYAAILDRRWRRCFDDPAACYVWSSHERRDGLPLQARRLLLPVSVDGSTASRLVGITHIDRQTRHDDAIRERGAERELRWTAIADLASP
jgi:hypothetical protein